MASSNTALAPNKTADGQRAEIYRYLVCSTAHLTEQDAELLHRLSHDRAEWGDGEWVHYTGVGYLIRLCAFNYPLLVLKRRGLSRPVRRFIHVMMTQFDVTLIHFDSCGEVLSGFDVHDW